MSAMVWGFAGLLALQLLTLMAVLASLRRLRREVGFLRVAAIGTLLREFRERGDPSP
jgi:hypothetical protein